MYVNCKRKYKTRPYHQVERHHLARTTPVIDGAILFKHRTDDDTAASVSTLVASECSAGSVCSYQSSNYERTIHPAYNPKYGAF